MPANIEKGQLAGPHLTAIVAYMKGACHCSFSTIRKFLRDVIGVTISRGQLSKLVQKAATALEQAYNELLEYLPYDGAKLNVDEQAMWFVVIDRYITQGTRSEKGRAWCERIWTVLATCASQSRSAFDFIYQSIQAHFSDQPLPPLLGP